MDFGSGNRRYICAAPYEGGGGPPFPERQNPIPPIPMSESVWGSEIPIPLYPPMVINSSCTASADPRAVNVLAAGKISQQKQRSSNQTPQVWRHLPSFHQTSRLGGWSRGPCSTLAKHAEQYLQDHNGSGGQAGH